MERKARKTTSSGSRERDGYTLLELVLVVVIVSVFAAVVVPKFSGFAPSLRVNRAAEEIMATARKAHACAVLHGLRYRLHIDAEGGEYRLTVQSRPFEDPEAWAAVVEAGSERFLLPEGVSVSAAGEYEFHPDGTATPGSIVIGNERGDSATVTIVGATGRVYVEDPDEEK